ncbi:MAG TPA: lysylphosphatidylglycerol synthase domain-containing protein, partial [Armatimonadota bacterium]|nr:lysylphosphatidylglycerol synthase domain-containing protein [Armatimonadota bacterium]
MLKAVRLLLLLGGVALAAYLVAQHSRDIGESLRQVGWGFAAYMAASFVVYALDSWGWRSAFVEGQPHTGFWRLFSIRMAGEAVNKVTPLASMGGEPLKGYLLTRAGTSSTHALASVAIAKNVMTLAQIAFIFCGVGLAWAALPGKTGLLIGLALFPGLILS